MSNSARWRRFMQWLDNRESDETITIRELWCLVGEWKKGDKC